MWRVVRGILRPAQFPPVPTSLQRVMRLSFRGAGFGELPSPFANLRSPVVAHGLCRMSGFGPVGSVLPAHGSSVRRMQVAVLRHDPPSRSAESPPPGRAVEVVSCIAGLHLHGAGARVLARARATRPDRSPVWPLDRARADARWIETSRVIRLMSALGSLSLRRFLLSPASTATVVATATATAQARGPRSFPLPLRDGREVPGTRVAAFRFETLGRTLPFNDGINVADSLPATGCGRGARGERLIWSEPREPRR